MWLEKQVRIVFAKPSRCDKKKECKGGKCELERYEKIYQKQHVKTTVWGK